MFFILEPTSFVSPWYFEAEIFFFLKTEKPCHMTKCCAVIGWEISKEEGAWGGSSNWDRNQVFAQRWTFKRWFWRNLWEIWGEKKWQGTGFSTCSFGMRVSEVCDSGRVQMWKIAKVARTQIVFVLWSWHFLKENLGPEVVLCFRKVVRTYF